MIFNNADKNALQMFFQSRPAWSGVLESRHAINQKEFTLLHSGPPMIGRKIKTTLNSAAVACVLKDGQKFF